MSPSTWRGEKGTVIEHFDLRIAGRKGRPPLPAGAGSRRVNLVSANDVGLIRIDSET